MSQAGPHDDPNAEAEKRLGKTTAMQQRLAAVTKHQNQNMARHNKNLAMQERLAAATKHQNLDMARQYVEKLNSKNLATSDQPPERRRSGWRPLLLVLRTLLVIAVAYGVVVTLGAVLQTRNAALADVSLALLIGLAFGVLCPEHWVWAAPLPTCIALTQAWGTAHAAAANTGDESLAGLVVAFAAYITLALLPAWISRIVLDRRSATGIPSVGNVS